MHQWARFTRAIWAQIGQVATQNVTHLHMLFLYWHALKKFSHTDRHNISELPVSSHLQMQCTTQWK